MKWNVQCLCFKMIQNYISVQIRPKSDQYEQVEGRKMRIIEFRLPGKIQLKIGAIFTHENSLNVPIFCSCIKCFYLNREKRDIYLNYLLRY